MRGDIVLMMLACAAMLFAVWLALSWRPEPVPRPTSHGGRTIATSTPSLWEERVEVVVPRQSASSTRATNLKIFGSIPYWDQPRAVAMFKKHVELFDLISVFWYRLDSA